MKLRDTQRSKLYAWENREIGAPAIVAAALAASGKADACINRVVELPLMELSEIRKLVTVVARDYGLTHRKVKVFDGRGRSHACYDASYRAIKMPRWSRKRWIVLHELAHWIVRVKWIEAASHGRQFVGIYMELLRRYFYADLADMQYTANAVGLDFVPNSECTARALKRHAMRWS